MTRPVWSFLIAASLALALSGAPTWAIAAPLVAPVVISAVILAGIPIVGRRLKL